MLSLRLAATKTRIPPLRTLGTQRHTLNEGDRGAASITLRVLLSSAVEISDRCDRPELTLMPHVVELTLNQPLFYGQPIRFPRLSRRCACDTRRGGSRYTRLRRRRSGASAGD